MYITIAVWAFQLF